MAGAYLRPNRGPGERKTGVYGVPHLCANILGLLFFSLLRGSPGTFSLLHFRLCLVGPASISLCQTFIRGQKSRMAADGIVRVPIHACGREDTYSEAISSSGIPFACMLWYF